MSRRPQIVVQQMSLAQFTDIAVVQNLVRGRPGWVVSVGKQSTGYAENSLETAVRDVHRGYVYRALNANSDPAYHWMNEAMPSAEALADYPDLAAQYAGLIAKASLTQPLAMH